MSVRPAAAGVQAAKGSVEKAELLREAEEKELTEGQKYVPLPPFPPSH